MTDKPYRLEQDSLGEIQVPKDALYGAQTQRAVNNFPVSGTPLPWTFIQTLILIKQTAAEVNRDLNLLPEKQAAAIIQACEALRTGNYQSEFPVDVFQTGSGTSSNMNVNEVIATLAGRTVPGIHPNDHVNMSQSSNDVIPSAIHLSSAIQLHGDLIPALQGMIEVLDTRSAELTDICKTGRTHLMDAMPITFGQELNTWATQCRHNIQRLQATQQRLHQLPLGGTAVGTGINAHPDFSSNIISRLAEMSGLPLSPKPSLMEGISSQDSALELSGQLRVTATSLFKIANDLRWMNSGPIAGLGEISLSALQPGSSIMPGKVNPVICESVMMVATQVVGHDSAIAMAAQGGNFQLNTMLPLIAHNLLQSIRLLSNANRLLTEKAIAEFRVNQANLARELALNPMLVTALNPIVGYQKAAEISKQAYREQRPVIDVATELTELSREELEQLLDPLKLTRGGIQK